MTSKSTQKDMVLDLFGLNSGSITLYQILQTQLAAEYRRLFTDMRHEGYGIHCERGDTPSSNTYILYATPQGSPYRGVMGHRPEVTRKLSQAAKKGTETRSESKVEGIIQVNKPCMKCGSYYRINGRCNRCG